FQHDRPGNLVLTRLFGVLRLRLRNQTRFRRHVLAGEDLVITTTAASTWSPATGIEVTTADVTAAAWSETATFTRSNTAAGSSADTVSSARTRRRIRALRLVVAVRQHAGIRWNEQRIGNYCRRHRQRWVLRQHRLRIRRHYLRNFQRRLRNFTERG